MMFHQALAQFAAESSIRAPGLPKNSTDNMVPTIMAILFGIIGAICLLMIVISGLRYITSAGDPQKAGSAKNGIIYALVGLAVALAAEGIVTFVVRSL
jgi:hypothetical protein